MLCMPESRDVFGVSWWETGRIRVCCPPQHGRRVWRCGWETGRIRVRCPSIIPFCPSVSLALFSSVLLPSGIFLLHSQVSLPVSVPEWVFPVALSCCFVCAYVIVIGMIMVLGGAFWIDIYHFYKQKIEIFSQNILQSHDKAVPLQPLLKKSFDHCNDSYGRLAQLVQSVCLTSRGSGVRIPQRPPGVSPVVPQGIAGEFVFR